MFRSFIRYISRWAWQNELQERDLLLEERNIMLEGLEECGWPCRLVELPKYYKELVYAYEKLYKEITTHEN